MAAANGFVTTTPDARYGDVTGSFSSGETWMQKFTCGGSGNQEISEIGLWGLSASANIKLAIFTDDAGNGCPDTMVANSETAEINLTSGSVIKVYHTYGTKPVLTGGTDYWICGQQSATVQPSAFASGSNKYKTSTTYGVWPSGDDWHTTSPITADWSLYAVYAAASATSQFARSIAVYYQRLRG